MKPLKECKWQGEIECWLGDYLWYIDIIDKEFSSISLTSKNDFKTKEACMKNLKKFFEINEIKNFEIKENEK